MYAHIYVYIYIFTHAAFNKTSATEINEYIEISDPCKLARLPDDQVCVSGLEPL